MGSTGRVTVTRMMWPDVCRSNKFSGRWVALDNVRYDQTTSQPLEADVVDVDEDLGVLCTRMRESDRTSCAILFCDEESFAAPVITRPSLITMGAPPPSPRRIQERR
jgi:hypothetical protein